MLAFSERGTIRAVDIPSRYDKITETAQVLELIFYYGQNDFQKKNFPSVSVGDVAEIDGEYHLCCNIGWERVSKEEFLNLTDKRFIVNEL